MAAPAAGRLRGLLGCATIMLLGACGSIPLQDAAPSGFNLAGHWVLNEDASTASGYRGGDLRSGFMSQDFPLLVTTEMRIEQDAHSMGIDYARGSYRDVTWGERRRGVWEVRAGWYEGDLHIYSKAPDASAAEIWHLSEDGQRLEVNIDVRSGRQMQFRRVFRRSASL